VRTVKGRKVSEEWRRLRNALWLSLIYRRIGARRSVAPRTAKSEEWTERTERTTLRHSRYLSRSVRTGISTHIGHKHELLDNIQMCVYCAHAWCNVNMDVRQPGLDAELLIWEFLFVCLSVSRTAPLRLVKSAVTMETAFTLH
jgi:hypothetical protein